MNNKKLVKISNNYDNSIYYLRLTSSERKLLEWLRKNDFLTDDTYVEDTEEPTTIEF